MGEAKRRGSFEDRKAHSIARQQAEETRRAEERARIDVERRRLAAERLKLLSPQERKEAVLVGGGGHNSRLMLALAAGLMAAPSVPMLIVDDASDGDSHG